MTLVLGQVTDSNSRHLSESLAWCSACCAISFLVSSISTKNSQGRKIIAWLMISLASSTIEWAWRLFQSFLGQCFFVYFPTCDALKFALYFPQGSDWLQKHCVVHSLVWLHPYTTQGSLDSSGTSGRGLFKINHTMIEGLIYQKSRIYFDEQFQEGDLKWNSCQRN